MPIQAAAADAADCLCSKRSLHSKPPPAASAQSRVWGRPEEPRRATISNPQLTPAQLPPPTAPATSARSCPSEPRLGKTEELRRATILDPHPTPLSLFWS